MNKVILIGRLTADPEIRNTTTGKTVATLRLAVSRRFSTLDGQPTADFFNIVAWEKLGEICKNYLYKGSQVAVEGRLQTRSYDAPDGSKRYITEIIASDIEFVGSKPSNSGNSNYSSQSQESNNGFNSTNDLGSEAPDEEIPF